MKAVVFRIGHENLGISAIYILLKHPLTCRKTVEKRRTKSINTNFYQHP